MSAVLPSARELDESRRGPTGANGRSRTDSVGRGCARRVDCARIWLVGGVCDAYSIFYESPKVGAPRAH